MTKTEKQQESFNAALKGIALKAYAMYAAQEIPQIDVEIAQKGHFRMETNLYQANRRCP